MDPNFNIGQIPTTQFNIPAPKPRGGGMFGGGGKKALSVIAEAMAAYAAGMGNPGGMAVLQGMNHRRQSAADAEAQEQQYQRQREDGLADYSEKLRIAQEFKGPDYPAFAQDLIAAGHQPGSPEFNRLYGQYVQQRAQSGGTLLGNLFKDPSTGQQYIPGSLPPLGQEMDDPRAQGGPSPLGSGGFPGSF
jgi:hypothetical protein